MALDRWHIPTTDDEIVDVFLEEVKDLLEDVDAHLMTWASHPSDQKSLIDIRRIFHTFKGSGRMVKALDLSEVAWKVENMLNQAMAGTVPPSEPMVKLVAAVRTQIPRMVDAFKNRRPVPANSNIEHLMALADALAAGRTPELAPASPVAAPGRAHPSLHELNLRIDRVKQRADEALHRSEMALQQARRGAAQAETATQAAGQGGLRTEMDRMGELVKRLTKEVSDLRLESGQNRKDSILQEGEVNQLVEQRVRARQAPNLERLRSEIKRDIEKSRQAATSGDFGWPALLLSGLLGAVIATAVLMFSLSIR